jgi:uncharacterized metal-binding protein
MVLEKEKPLVYSCTGYASVAQIADYPAIEMGRNVEMK